MKIMTWNIENGGTLSDLFCPVIENIQNILLTIESAAPDVVIIQEYLSEYSTILLDNGLIKMGYKYIKVCEDAPDKTLRKRVLVASKFPIEKQEYPTTIDEYSRRNWCEVILRNDNDKIHILGVDVPLAETVIYGGEKQDNRAQKKKFLEAMLSKFNEYANLDQYAIILGDFNLHKNAVYNEYLGKFNEYLQEITNDDATWKNKKLDYIYVNKTCHEIIYEKEKLVPIHTEYSDHKYFCFKIEIQRRQSINGLSLRW